MADAPGERKGDTAAVDAAAVAAAPLGAAPPAAGARVASATAGGGTAHGGDGAGSGTAAGSGTSEALLREVAELRRANAALTAAVQQLLPRVDGMSQRFESLEQALATMAEGQAVGTRLLQGLAAAVNSRSGLLEGAGAGAGAGAGGVRVTNGGATGVGARARPMAKPVKANAGTMHLWTGTWNMGGVDTLEHLDPDGEPGRVSAMLEAWVPQGYDVYVLAVQECVGESLYTAFAQHTGTYMLPLNSKLLPAREDATTEVRSRRMGHAINVGQLMDDADNGLGPDPVVTAADMLDRVRSGGHFTGVAVFVAPVVAPYVRLLGVYKHSFGAMAGSHGTTLLPLRHPVSPRAGADR